MKVLIAYASKTGTTEKCAKELAEKLPQVTVVDLNNEQTTLEEYDVVIVGTSIRMGMIHKSAKQWITANWDTLKEKHLGCFFCNAFIEQEAEIIQHNFSEEFQEHAFFLKSFGGEMNMDKIKGLDKFITNLITGAMKDKANGSVTILEDRIQEMANAILGL